MEDEGPSLAFKHLPPQGYPLPGTARKLPQHGGFAFKRLPGALEQPWGLARKSVPPAVKIAHKMMARKSIPSHLKQVPHGPLFMIEDAGGTAHVNAIAMPPRLRVSPPPDAADEGVVVARR